MPAHASPLLARLALTLAVGSPALVMPPQLLAAPPLQNVNQEPALTFVQPLVQAEQVRVSVTVCELSLTQARTTQPSLADVDPRRQVAHGFQGALANLAQEEPLLTPGEERPQNDELLYRRTIADTDGLHQLVDELQELGVLKIIAQTTLTTGSGQSAALHVGGEFPIQVPQDDGHPRLELLKFGTQLSIHPEVLEQRRVQLDVKPRISELDFTRGVQTDHSTIPGRRVREVHAIAQIEEGHTLVLAGMVQHRHPQPEASAPLVGPSPGLGKPQDPLQNSSSELPGDRAGASSDRQAPDLPPAQVPSPAAGPPGPRRDALEEVELVVLVRAEILPAP